MLKHGRSNHTPFPQFLSQSSTLTWHIYSSCGVLQTRSHLPVTLSLTYHFFNSSVILSPSTCAMSWHIFFSPGYPSSCRDHSLLNLLHWGSWTEVQEQVCLLISSNMADYTIYMVDFFLDHKVWLSRCQDSNVYKVHWWGSLQSSSCSKVRAWSYRICGTLALLQHLCSAYDFLYHLNLTTKENARWQEGSTRPNKDFQSGILSRSLCLGCWYSMLCSHWRSLVSSKSA